MWACGAWLGHLFSDLVRLRVTFQQLTLFDVPPEWRAPGWVDFDAAFYGHGLVEPYGMKVAADHDGVEVDPDERPLEATPEAAERRASTWPTASRRSPPRPCAERPPATTGSPRTASSSSTGTRSTRASGSSAAAPGTATSTGRRWPSTWRRCSPAGASPSRASRLGERSPLAQPADRGRGLKPRRAGAG